MNDMINLDYQSRIPIYEQIMQAIEKYVSLGVLKPNEQIMSIRELASSLRLNPNTIKKAYDELENLGVITTVPTKGTYITQNTDGVVNKKVNEYMAIILKTIEELEKLGISKDEIKERMGI